MNEIHVVGAVIQRKNGELLCAQRSETMKQPLLWEFPGGKVEGNETHEQALVREIREELNCMISVGQYITSSDVQAASPKIVLHTYLCEPTEGEPTPLEHKTVCWLRPADLQTLQWAPADIDTVDWLMKRI
ncbi:(deoxy)nucleoside triphosphate pyrophosphohydrolase [Aureibacillus halotolerans]|uniref:8-oxo-dGTP diphosphatase n=1 Tax=Aureibacillus halotolerans TaxID=1508390 RepID=A0A4R6U9A6_9BACI|nr:(deoxy)nucleoside triphosphate pyrophosphohydrolase [Aureibacillus halotolerans]TDQ41255.1 8-oxo-dGTP diphosphatase [Aureibacillus halotolerans]